MRSLVLAIGLISCSFTLSASCDWPLWQQFSQHYIEHGRVIDGSDPRQITTSEGQAYGLFFALAANDRDQFSALLEWTEEHLFAGDITARLPAWLWGKSDDGWQVLDPNPASDADIWMAYTLLEAGRLWQLPRYQTLGYLLAKRISQEETVNIPNFGRQLLPAPHGFVSDQQEYRLNPSYLPLQLLDRLAQLLPNSHWPELKQNSAALLPQLMPQGFMPDWITLHQGNIKFDNAMGSYDAIRHYLWVGMLTPNHPQRTQLLEGIQPMLAVTQQRATPPEKIRIIDGKLYGHGPYGFSAALLPALRANNNNTLAELQQQRVQQGLAASQPRTDYYNQVLSLFALGWQQYYQFAASGELQTHWGNLCK